MIAAALTLMAVTAVLARRDRLADVRSSVPGVVGLESGFRPGIP